MSSEPLTNQDFKLSFFVRTKSEPIGSNRAPKTRLDCEGKTLRRKTVVKAAITKSKRVPAFRYDEPFRERHKKYFHRSSKKMTIRLYFKQKTIPKNTNTMAIIWANKNYTHLHISSSFISPTKDEITKS